MQKCYTVDFLTKKQEVNRGVLPQYYVEGDHDAIIDPETFELVQQEMARRMNKCGHYSGVDIFSSRIICGECGSYYGAKVWHSNSKYRRVIYRCNHKYQEGKTCETPHIAEEEIKQWFVSALNKLLDCKDEVIGNLEAMEHLLFDTTELKKDRTRLEAEMELVGELIQRAISENAQVAQDQQAYRIRFDELSERYEKTKQQCDGVVSQIADKASRRAAMRQFTSTLKKQTALATEFDPTLWGVLLDHVTIHAKDDVRFTLKDGTEMRA